MTDIGVALGMAAPYYNLAFVVVAIWLFIVLFRTPSKKAFMAPWYLLFAALMLFVLEEVITVLRAAGLVSITVHINAFFELGIIILFVYLILLQKEFIKKCYRPRKRAKKAKKSARRKVKKRKKKK